MAPTPSFMNRDLEMINSSKKSSPKSSALTPYGVSRLPKLSFAELTQNTVPILGSGSLANSYSKLPQGGNNAIDSHRALSIAYYTRRLLLIGWKAFFNHRLECANQRFQQRIVRAKNVKNLKKKSWKGLSGWAKQHRGQGNMRRQAIVMSNQRLGEKYLKKWI